MERKTADKKPAEVKVAQSNLNNNITLVCLAAMNDVEDGENGFIIQRFRLQKGISPFSRPLR